MSAACASLVCEAIRTRTLLAFDYHGLPRVVACYCHGVSVTGRPVVRAIQVRGRSKSGGFGFGKLWLLVDIVEPRLLPESFVPDDPDYNPDDSAIATIHCRV